VNKFRLCLVRIFLVILESFRRALLIVEDRSLLGGGNIHGTCLSYRKRVMSITGGVVNSGLADRGVTDYPSLPSFLSTTITVNGATV